MVIHVQRCKTMIAFQMQMVNLTKVYIPTIVSPNACPRQNTNVNANIPL